MNSVLNQIYEDGIKYSQAQEICKKVLIQKISTYNFKNVKIKCLVNNIVEKIIFPLDYRTDIEETIVCKKTYKNIAYGLFIVGIIAGLILLTQKNLNALWPILSGLSIGLSISVYRASKKTKFQKKIKIITSHETLVRFIDETYKDLIMLDNISLETRVIHKELLIWFQKLYSWACSEFDRHSLKKDISDIMMRFGYEFIEYTSQSADFFESTNANVENVTTTVYALHNAIDQDIILRGKVVFPYNKV